MDYELGSDWWLGGAYNIHYLIYVLSTVVYKVATWMNHPSSEQVTNGAALDTKEDERDRVR
jgi:hypothetical protein